MDQKSGFTDQKSSGGLTDQKITSSGEDVNDSPDSSLEPEDHHNGLLHETPSINKIVSTAVIRYLRPEFKFSAKIEMAFSQMLAIRS